MTDLSSTPWDVILGSFVRGRVNVPRDPALPPFTLDIDIPTPDGAPGDLTAVVTGTATGRSGGMGIDLAEEFPAQAPTPVPEPSSMVLLGSGLLAVAVRARRQILSRSREQAWAAAPRSVSVR